MSGGHFDYYQYHIEEIADKLERVIADVEYAKEIGKVKKRELYAHLVNVDSGAKYWPHWLMEMCYRYETRDEFVKSLKHRSHFHEKDGKIFVEDYNGFCEVVVYEGESEEWSDGNWHREIEDPEVLEEFKKGLKILRTAAVYAQRIDWLLCGDDGEETFKERLKDELGELDSKPLVDYEYWKKVFTEENED